MPQEVPDDIPGALYHIMFPGSKEKIVADPALLAKENRSNPIG